MKKKLTRNQGSERMLAGILSGFSEYFQIDVVIIRLVFAGLFFTPIPVVILYFVAWIIVPKDTDIHQSLPEQITQ